MNGLMQHRYILRKHLPFVSIGLIFVLLLIFNFLLAVGSGPVFFADSIDYILAAQHLLSNGHTAADLLLEVPVGFPKVVAFFFANTSDPFFWLVLVQAGAVMLVDLLVVFTAYLLFRRAAPAVVCGLISACMLEKAYLAGSILTEPLFLFFILLSMALFALAWEKKNLLLYLASIICFLISGLFRHTSMMLWFIPVFSWLLFSLRDWYSRALESQNKHPGVSVLLKSLVFLTVNFLLIAAMRSPFAGNIGTKEKLSVLWVRTIQLSPKGQKAFRKENPEFMKDFNAWLKSHNLSKSIMDKEPLWVTADNDPREVKKRWKMLEKRKLTYWKSPRWYLMMQHGLSYEEASRWQGEVAVDYLVRFYPTYLKEILTDTADRLLGKPIRSSFFVVERQKENNHTRIKYSPSDRLALGSDSTLRHMILPISIRFNKILKFMSSSGFLYVYNLSLIAGAMMGFVLRPTPVYWNIGLIVLLTLSINAGIGGDLPRYRLLLLPFSGMFLMNLLTAASLAIAKMKRHFSTS